MHELTKQQKLEFIEWVVEQYEGIQKENIIKPIESICEFYSRYLLYKIKYAYPYSSYALFLFTELKNKLEQKRSTLSDKQVNRFDGDLWSFDPFDFQSRIQFLNELKTEIKNQ